MSSWRAAIPSAAARASWRFCAGVRPSTRSSGSASRGSASSESAPSGSASSEPTSSGPAGEPVALAALGAALAAAEALTYLDAGVPRTRGATYEIAMPDLLPRLRAWAVHPDCGCTALPRTPVPALAPTGQ